MLTRQVTDYIGTELNQGRTPEEIRINLLESGWSDEDIKLAFSSVKPNKRFSKKLIIIPVLIIIVLLVVWPTSNTSDTGNDSKITPSPDIENTTPFPTKPGPSPTKKPKVWDYPVSQVPYYNPIGKYRFTYPVIWSVRSEGSQTFLNIIESGGFENYTGSGDIVFSVRQYDKTETASPKSAQALEIANSLDSDRKTTPVKVGKWSGWEALHFSPPDQVLSMIFPGSENILIIQFPGVINRASVSSEQLAVIGSLAQP